jgi:hypothetical protein
VGRPVGRELSDNSCIELARRWVSECQEHHPQCRQSPTSRLPTRLIDVSSEERGLRLVETLGGRGQYAALVHCWGKAQPLTTTSATLKDHLKAIPLSSLPKTFFRRGSTHQKTEVAVSLDRLAVHIFASNRMKDLGTLRFAPQKTEGFNFTLLASSVFLIGNRYPAPLLKILRA